MAFLQKTKNRFFKYFATRDFSCLYFDRSFKKIKEVTLENDLVKNQTKEYFRSINLSFKENDLLLIYCNKDVHNKVAQSLKDI